MLGVEIESPGTVAAVVTVSVLLAVAVWRRPSTVVYALVGLFTTGATVFDIAEIRHQVGDGTAAFAVIAAAVAALHAATVLVAAKTTPTTRRPSPRTV